MDQFEWPWQYKFPPFFTIQPNLETQKKQVTAWGDLILAYHKHHKLYSLDVKEAVNSPLFCNNEIQRKLPAEGVIKVLDALAVKGNIEWSDKSKSRCVVMWRTPAEWGNLIYKWACKSGMKNTVCTLYELTSGNDTKGEEFYGLEDWLLSRALRVLQRQQKAEIISFDGNEGVKFF